MKTDILTYRKISNKIGLYKRFCPSTFFSYFYTYRIWFIMKAKHPITSENLNIYEKRFLLMMKMIKIDQMLKSAKITHKKMAE